jgi:hypothetical protein
VLQAPSACIRVRVGTTPSFLPILLRSHDYFTYQLQYYQHQDDAEQTGRTSTTDLRYHSMLLWTHCRSSAHVSHAERLLVLPFRWALRGSTTRIHQVTDLAYPYTTAGLRRSTPFASALEKSVCRRLSIICPCEYGPARTHPVATSQHYRPPAD